MVPKLCVGIGTVPEFHIGDDWQSYSERLDQFFIANFVEEYRKVAVLITVIEASAYVTLREICDPVLPNTVKYDKLCDIVSKQFASKVAIFRKRSVFYQLIQEQNESVNDLYVRIKKGAMKCNFGNNLVDVLRDKFVTGLIKGPIADHVCEEEPTKFLVNLVDIALRKEAVVVQSKSQTTINHVSRFTAKVEFNNKVVDCEFIVVKSTENPYPLCGRNLLSKLGISWVQLNSIQDNKKARDLNELLIEYKNLFSGKLGEYAHMEDIHYPFPRIKDLFATVQGGQTFSKLDFTWSTQKGTYEVLRLLYGIKPATAIFQREVENIFKKCAFTANLLDDIVVTGRNDEEHFKNLAEVFNRCKRTGFQFNRTKCQFFQPSIKYSGHIIDKDGVRKDPEKVNCICKIARPQNVTEFKLFLGMINYIAFNRIKTILMSEQVLTHYNPDLPVVLTCDALNNGLGAVLCHVLSDNTEKPINFTFRALSSAEKNYSTTHKEALAMVWGITKKYQYLKGRELIIMSNHKPVITLLGEDKVIPKMASGRVQRWAFFCLGTNNTAADSLSRISHSNYNFTTKDDLVDQAVDVINWVNHFVPVDYLQIRTETSKDPTIKKVINYMNTHWPKEVTEDVKPFYNRRDELVYESKILISYFWWPSLDLDIKHYKWPDIFEVSKADTHNTIEKLKEIFSRYGLPDTIVTDNGTPFTSEELSEFCELNSIKHLTSSPHWHPSSNGAAENAVKSFKIGFGKILMNKSEEANIILNKIKPKPHSCTAIDRQIRNYKGNILNKVFIKNDAVFIRDYSKPNKKGWKTCIIDEIVGNNIYICKEQLTNRHFKRYADQIVKAGTFYQSTEPLISEPEQTVEGDASTQVVVTDVPKEINSFEKSKLNDNSLAGSTSDIISSVNKN
ncbi:hypothetical protein QTP88_005749 [Uroleucon formosanum]